MTKVQATYPNMNYVDKILNDVDDPVIKHEWESIIELKDKAKNEFPTGKFPDWIEDFVHEVSHAVQSPKDMSYALAIGVLSISLTRKFKVKLSNAQTESLNTYTAIIADSGERKSATFNPFLKPIESFEKRLQEDSREQIARRASFRKSLEIKRAAVEKQINKQYEQKGGADKKIVADLTDELSTINYEILEHPPIVEPMITIGDTTPEKFSKVLYEQNETISIASAESTFFSDFAGAYNSSTPRQESILGAYSGDTYKISRMNDQSDGITLSEPYANVLVMVQPTVLENVNEALKGRGLLNRFFYYKPTSMVGYRKVEDRDINEQVKARYFNNICQMLKLKQDDKVLKLSNKAKQLFQSFAENNEHDLREGNSLHEIQGWGNRLPTSVIKIAGLMHVAEHISTPLDIPSEINERTIMNAIDLASYMVHQTKSITDMMNVDEVDKIAEKMLSLITTDKQFKGVTDIKARELKARIYGRENEKLKDVAIGKLAERNYLRRYKDGQKKMIEINPALLGGV